MTWSGEHLMFRVLAEIIAMFGLTVHLHVWEKCIYMLDLAHGPVCYMHDATPGLPSASHVHELEDR